MMFLRKDPEKRRHRTFPDGAFWAAYARLVEEGFIEDRESRGLPESALEEISRDQGVPLVPEYADFLRCMGAGSGRTLASETVFHPAVLGMRANAEAMCTEFGITWDPEVSLFVASHQGHTYYCIDLREGGAVHCLTEDCTAAIRVADSFSEFFSEFVRSA